MDTGWRHYRIITVNIELGISMIDGAYQTSKANLSDCINAKDLNEVEKEKSFKSSINYSKKRLDEAKEKWLKECIDIRDKYLKFGKCYFSLYYRMLANTQIKKLVKKIEKFEKYLENQEKELLKNSNEKASLVLEDKK